MFRQFREDLLAFARTAYHTGSVLTAWRLCLAGRREAEVRLPGFAERFRLRCGTTDAAFLRALANGDFPPEYELPADFEPGVIFDIGANVGGVAAALLRRWPGARLYAFEPLPENAALLQHNLRGFSHARVLPYGLADRTARLTYERSDDVCNFGGGGFHGQQSDPSRCLKDVPVVAVGEALQQLGVSHIDLIKIDTEGAEHAILTSFPEEVLRRVRFIVGELHLQPQDEALLDYLGGWFDLDVKRCPHTGHPRYFRACLRDTAADAHAENRIMTEVGV